MSNSDPFGWVDEREVEIEKEKEEGYFNIVEGQQKFVLLTHCAPLAQVWDNAMKRYRVAQEGDKASIKGLCWIWQDGLVKQAKLPYTVVKAIRSIQQEPEWDFEIPFRHPLTLTAKGAGTKEVEYTLTPSPKMVEIPDSVLEELAKKPTPEAVIEKIKGGAAPKAAEEDTRDAPDPDDITAF